MDNWTETPEINSADSYKYIERRIVESIWDGTAAVFYMNQKLHGGMGQSLFPRAGFLFIDLDTNEIWHLVTPDFPSKGSFTNIGKAKSPRQLYQLPITPDGQPFEFHRFVDLKPGISPPKPISLGD